MNKQMTLEQAIQNIRAKFTSGNSVPVERATITATEWAAIDAHLNAAKGAAVDTGNLVSDPLYLVLDQLYERGWSDGEKHKHDPRGTNEWQRVLDIFRQYAHPTSPDVVRDAARYRWLRDVGDATWTALSERMPHYNIDRAIDAAMAAREGGE